MTLNLSSRRLKDVSILSAAAVLLQVVLSKWIYPLFGATTEQLFSITPQTALTSPTLGNKILGFLSGLSPLTLGDLMSWLTIYLGAFLVIYAGYWVYDQRWAWKGRNLGQRLWAILGYGSAVLYAFVVLLKLQSFATMWLQLLIGMAINYAIIALSIAMLATRVKFFRFLRV